MSQSTQKKMRRLIRKSETKLRKEMEFEANEVLQAIKEEWSWKERLKLVWFLLFSKKKG